MSSVLLGYTFLFEGLNKALVFFMVTAYGTLMVSSFLAFGATGEFKITYLGIGPTEIRALFIILNCSIIFFGTGFIEKSLLYVFILFMVGLCVVIYRTSKYIWNIDMQNKDSKS